MLVDNQEVIQNTLRNYEMANQALYDLWDKFDPQVIDEILEKQQNRLQQIVDRIYHQEQLDEFSDDEIVLLNTIQRYEWANQYLFEHWDSLQDEERLSIIQKQWNRLEEMRRRHKNINVH